MGRLLVTVGTDGNTDWVKLPNGQKLLLGPVSVLRLVSTVALTNRAAKSTLETFLKEGEAFCTVDEEKMWALFEPRRALWASGPFPFMPTDHRIDQGQGTMPKIHVENLTKLETHIQALNKAAANKIPAAKMAGGHAILDRLVRKIQMSDPSEALTLDTVRANEAVVSDILAKAEETASKIDKLAEAGKPFRADKARSDVYAVTSKVASLLHTTDLTASWVQGDLQKLSTRMNELHSLFAPAKV